MIIGRLGRDPEMRYTPQGTAVTTFSVATGGKWTDRNGNERDDTEWFRVEAWERLAETCNEYLSKGREVYIEGRIKVEQFTDREGRERTAVKVVANTMLMLGSKGDSQYSGRSSDDQADDMAESDRPAPQGGGRNRPQPIREEATEDDIPF
jgi:single-strand DNA-binding protein